MTTVLMVFS